MEKLTLKSISCQQPSETDKDEIFLMYRGEKIWPTKAKFAKIDSNETIELNITLDRPTVWVEIELWEYDYLSKNDHLGDFVFKSQNYANDYTCELKEMDEFIDKVKYTLNYQIVR